MVSYDKKTLEALGIGSGTGQDLRSARGVGVDGGFEADLDAIDSPRLRNRIADLAGQGKDRHAQRLAAEYASRDMPLGYDGHVGVDSPRTNIPAQGLQTQTGYVGSSPVMIAYTAEGAAGTAQTRFSALAARAPTPELVDDAVVGSHVPGLGRAIGDPDPSAS